jgi:hypothetical protein
MRAGSGETELAFFGSRRNARPPSRFSSEIGMKADAKQQSRDRVRMNAREAECGTAPEELARGCRMEVQRFFG